MPQQDLSKRYHLERRLLAMGELQDWESESTYNELHEAIRAYNTSWREGFSFARVRDTHTDQIVYPKRVGAEYL